MPVHKPGPVKDGPLAKPQGRGYQRKHAGEPARTNVDDSGKASRKVDALGRADSRKKVKLA